MPKRSKSEKGKFIAPSSSSKSKPPFVSSQAEHRYILLSEKTIISGRCVVLQDFEHLNIPHILRNNSLDQFMSIKEPVYTSLIPYFYTNLSYEGNRVRSRVLGRDIDISLQEFADLLHLSCEGVDVYSFDLQDFEYPAGEFALTASTLLHGDDNPGLVRNEEVRYYTLTAQVLAKFVFYNLLPKSGGFSHARGSVPLIVYCLLRGIKINIPRFIISHMTSDHVHVPTRHLPYGMIISYLLRQLDFDLSSLRPTEPSVNLNSSLLKRMQAGMRHPAPQQPPIPPTSSIPGSSSAPGSSIPSDLHAFISSEL